MKYKKLYLKFWLKAFGKDNGELPPPSASTAWNPIFYALAIGVGEIIVDPMEFAILVNGKQPDADMVIFHLSNQVIEAEKDEMFVLVATTYGIRIMVDRHNHKLPKGA